MSNEPGATAQGSSLDRVRAALAELGCATPAVIAARAELGYSTVPKKLRTLQTNGHVEPVTVDDRTQWRLTDAGRAYHSGATTTPSPDDISTHPAPASAEQPAVSSTSAAPANPATPPDTSTSEVHPADNDSDDLVGDDTAESQTRTVAPDDEQSSDDEPSPEAGTDADTDGPTDADTSTEAVPDGGDESAGQSTGRSPARRVRKKGALRQEILDLLRARRGTALSTGEICKLIDQANEGNDVNKASAGAVANALDILVGSGDVTLTKPDKGAARYEAVTSSVTV